MAVLQDIEGEDAGEKDWLVQMRSLIRNAIYNISYIRGLFPDDYFRDASDSESGVTVKRLIPKDIEARRLIGWIEEGVDDALQKKYLETAVFYISHKNEGAAIDEYSFKFSYPSHDSAVMEFSLTGNTGNGAAFKSKPAESIDIQIRSIIRVCATVTSTLAPLPDERTILMKLMYYDDMTPEDYEPPMFECCLDDEDDKDLGQMFGRLCCISKRALTLLIDSGATHHICCEKSYMTDMKKIKKKNQIGLITADGTNLTAKETGLIEFGNIHLNQMRYIPSLKFNVISIGYLDKQGLLVTIANSEIWIIDVKNSIQVGAGYRHRHNNDYVLKSMNWVVQTEVKMLPDDVVEDVRESWVIDTCCACHMAGSLDMLSDAEADEKVYQTPRATMKSTHIGSVRNQKVKLYNVRYCPANKDNLLSVGSLDSQGYRFTFYNGVCTIVCKDSLAEVGRAKLDSSNLLYYLKAIETNVVSKRKRSKLPRRI